MRVFFFFWSIRESQCIERKSLLSFYVTERRERRDEYLELRIAFSPSAFFPRDLKFGHSMTDSVQNVFLCFQNANHRNSSGISSYFFEILFSTRSARSTRRKYTFFRRNIVTFFTSFAPYLSSLLKYPKNINACKASMKVRQNVTIGILTLTFHTEKWISSDLTS